MPLINKNVQIDQFGSPSIGLYEDHVGETLSIKNLLLKVLALS